MQVHRSIRTTAPEDLVRGRWVISIEGMGRHDDRDPDLVAERVARNLAARGVASGPASPALIVTQGDPASDRGIAAITRRVAGTLGLERAMSVFDPAIDPDHEAAADVRDVRQRCYYSQLARLAASLPGPPLAHRLALIERRVDEGVGARNVRRAAIGKAPLAEYFARFARLQELTKSVLGHFAEGLLVAHTADEISPFSVTSFCDVGLDSGLIARTSMVAYGGDERAR